MEKLIIGVDDAGRGAVAGPLVICAFHCKDPQLLRRMGVRDSKQTTQGEREAIVARMRDSEQCTWTLGVAEPAWIETIGLTNAEGQKIRSALSEMIDGWWELGRNRVKAVIDGGSNHKNLLEGVEMVFVPRADATNPLVSAASVVASWWHARQMERIDAQHPEWEFVSHRGYDTERHRELIYRHGLSATHRTKSCLNLMKKHAKKHSLPVPEWATAHPKWRP